MDNDNATAGEADFPAWYRRTSPRVYAYVRRYCADDDCDDVIAEVYLVAWTRLAELPADAVPWLIGTARNVLANSWRARGRRGRLAAELAGLHDLAAADPASLAVERTDLLRAISRLSADDQEVLLLAGWDGLDSSGLATVLIAGGLFAQVLVPLGDPGSPQVAQALDRLAAAVPASPVIPDGSYELTAYEEAGIAESNNGPYAYATVRSTWLAADGWAWAHQTGDDPAFYIFRPVPRNYDLNAVPADPTVMEAYLRARVMGSSSVEEALFEAVKETLVFTPTPAATRAASIRMLAGVPGVTVTENTTDPRGRPATKVAFVDKQHRPGIVNAIYVDPATTQVVAELRTQNGQPLYTCIYTERRIVTSLPTDIIKTLGADRVEKSIP